MPAAWLTSLTTVRLREQGQSVTAAAVESSCYAKKFFFSLGVPVLVPVRASPVPSVVRGSFVVKFFSLAQHWARDWRALALTQVNL